MIQYSYVACMGEKCTESLGREICNKSPIGRHRCRWDNNIKTDVKERGWEDVDWIPLAPVRGQWQAFVNMVMNPQVPKITQIS
jgi:hypothetical protein